MTARQLSTIRGMQQMMLQKMMHIRRGPADTDEVFMTKLNSKIRALKLRHAFRDWDFAYHLSVFQWAGHVARMGAYDPQRLTYKILQHKCWREIQRIK